MRHIVKNRLYLIWGLIRMVSMRQPGQKNRYNPSLEILFDSPVQARPDLLWREVEGETVLLDPQRGHYYGIEGCGTRVWQLLQEETTLGDVLLCLLEEYDVEERELRQGLVEIYQGLRKSGLLKGR